MCCCSPVSSSIRSSSAIARSRASSISRSSRSAGTRSRRRGSRPPRRARPRRGGRRRASSCRPRAARPRARHERAVLDALLALELANASTISLLMCPTPRCDQIAPHDFVVRDVQRLGPPAVRRSRPARRREATSPEACGVARLGLEAALDGRPRARSARGSGVDARARERRRRPSRRRGSAAGRRDTRAEGVVDPARGGRRRRRNARGPRARAQAPRRPGTRRLDRGCDLVAAASVPCRRCRRSSGSWPPLKKMGAARPFREAGEMWCSKCSKGSAERPRAAPAEPSSETPATTRAAPAARPRVTRSPTSGAASATAKRTLVSRTAATGAAGARAGAPRGRARTRGSHRSRRARPPAGAPRAAAARPDTSVAPTAVGISASRRYGTGAACSIPSACRRACSRRSAPRSSARARRRAGLRPLRPRTSTTPTADRDDSERLPPRRHDPGRDRAEEHEHRARRRVRAGRRARARRARTRSSA